MMVVKTNFYIVKHAQLLEQTDILEGSRDACLIDLDCLVTGNVLSIQQNPSAIRLVHARQKVENSRFTSAVRSDQADFVAAQNGVGKRLDNRLVTERLGNTG